MLSASTADAAAAWIARDVYGLSLDRGDARPTGSTREETGTEDDPNAPPPIRRESANPDPIGIGANARRNAGPSPLLLVGGDDAFSLDAGDNLRSRIASADASLAAATRVCTDPQRPPTRGQQGGAFPIAAIGAVANLLRTDTEISGVDVQIAYRLLVSTVGDRLHALGMGVRLGTHAMRKKNAAVGGPALIDDLAAEVAHASPEGAKAMLARLAAGLATDVWLPLGGGRTMVARLYLSENIIVAALLLSAWNTRPGAWC